MSIEQSLVEWIEQKAQSLGNIYPEPHTIEQVTSEIKQYINDNYPKLTVKDVEDGIECDLIDFVSEHLGQAANNEVDRLVNKDS